MLLRPTVVLFDIDGTLVTCGGAGRRAMERAFAEDGLTGEASDFSFGGMTDRAIVREAFARVGRAIDEAGIDRALARYLDHLADELPRAARYATLPGVEAVLDDLDALRRTGAALAIGLGTGNLVRGAEIKLRPRGLWERFAFGGFGSDHEDRALLLRRGAERGAATLGRNIDETRIVVIGDTPRDVTAAHAIGARCVAVATGTYDLDALRAERPHATLETLAALTRAHLSD